MDNGAAARAFGVFRAYCRIEHVVLRNAVLGSRGDDPGRLCSGGRVAVKRQQTVAAARAGHSSDWELSASRTLSEW